MEIKTLFKLTLDDMEDILIAHYLEPNKSVEQILLELKIKGDYSEYGT